MPCYALLCYAMLCLALLCFAIWNAMQCYDVMYFAVPCYLTRCSAALCFSMLCYAMLCFPMLCNALLSALLSALLWSTPPRSAPFCSVPICPIFANYSTKLRGGATSQRSLICVCLVRSNRKHCMGRRYFGTMNAQPNGLLHTAPQICNLWRPCKDLRSVRRCARVQHSLFVADKSTSPKWTLPGRFLCGRKP